MAVLAVVTSMGCGRLAFDPRADGGTGDGALRDASGDASPGFIAFEAESGAVVAPFRVDEDTALHPGLFFVIDGNSRGLAGVTGSVGFTVKITRAGTYHLWLRSRPKDQSDDSFFVSFDGGVPQYVPTGECIYGADWHWGAWRDTTACPTLGALLGVSFSVGDHTIDVSSREGESMIDRLILSDNGTFVPID